MDWHTHMIAFPAKNAKENIGNRKNYSDFRFLWLKVSQLNMPRVWLDLGSMKIGFYFWIWRWYSGWINTLSYITNIMLNQAIIMRQWMLYNSSNNRFNQKQRRKKSPFCLLISHQMVFTYNYDRHTHTVVEKSTQIHFLFHIVLSISFQGPS